MTAPLLRALRGGAMLLALVTSVPFAQTPERPRLPRDADPNDWEAYYDLGMQRLQKGDGTSAETAFLWADS